MFTNDNIFRKGQIRWFIPPEEEALVDSRVIKKGRPVLIISDDYCNTLQETVLVVPLSSTIDIDRVDYTLPVINRDTKFRISQGFPEYRVSMLQFWQTRPADKKYLGNVNDILTEGVMEIVDIYWRRITGNGKPSGIPSQVLMEERAAEQKQKAEQAQAITKVAEPVHIPKYYTMELAEEHAPEQTQTKRTHHYWKTDEILNFLIDYKKLDIGEIMTKYSITESAARTAFKRFKSKV